MLENLHFQLWFPKIINQGPTNHYTTWILDTENVNEKITKKKLAKGARFGDNLGEGCFFDVSFDLKK